MEADRLSLKLKPSTKVKVRKDLFGSSSSQTDCDIRNKRAVNAESPLESIWGESDSLTQPSNSLLLSPALKRSPNRFGHTSPSPKKSPSTPKKKASSPRKLSKYSPFRKKVYNNVSPQETIKNFFQVKERNFVQVECTVDSQSSPGIKRIESKMLSNYNVSNCAKYSTNSGPCTSVSSSSSTYGSTNTNSFVDTDKSTSNTNCQEYNENPCSGPSSSSPAKIDNPSTVKVQTTGTPIRPTDSNRSNASTPQSAKKVLSPSTKLSGAKDVYGSFVLKIILDTMIHESDENCVKILGEDEYACITRFNNLDQPSQRLYGRLLNRKIDWIRTSKMKYGEVTLQLLLLEQNGFISSDCSGESLETLLNLLLMPELKKLCKSLKIPEVGVKSDLITRLISRTKQPSIKSFFTKFSGNSLSSNECNLRGKIYEILGPVIKVASGPCRTFSRCLLFFSYPHFRGLERDRFSDQLALVSQVRNLAFPLYEINQTNIFHSRENFLLYESALLESSELLEAKEDKDWEKALEKAREILTKLQCYLSNEDIRMEVEAMPDFLRRFTAGSCYVRAAGGSVDVFKKWDHSLKEAEECLELLLSQRLFSRHRRGMWFDQLVQLYQNKLKDNDKASNTVLRAMRDEYIDEVSRHSLCARALMLECRKKNGLKDYLKDALATQRALIQPLEEPPAITITEQVLNSNRQGLKQVYVQDTENGKMLSSVEEVAREHFRKQGFTRGGHDEGSIIKSLIFACFWNEIYGEFVTTDGHGLFHSEFQTVPLDWNSETFYDRRREKLKSKLQDLAEGGVEAVLTTFTECFSNNLNKESVVNWKYLDNYEITKSLILSIEIDVFLKLSRLLLRQHRIYGAGFPDLTLWDPEEKKCVFVEVKSPNDQLSMRQRVWLHNLNKMGASALVCHVNSVGCKGLKRRSSPTRDSQ